MANQGANNTVVAIGEGTELSFSTSDIQGMTLTGDGELIIALTNGETFTIQNFDELALNRTSLTLSDGEIIDSSSLYQSLAGALPPITIGQPAAGTAVEYELQPGQKYVVDFATGIEHQSNEQDGTLIIVFGDNGTIILKNFTDAMDAEVPAEISFEGQYISLREFADALRLAEAMKNEIEEGQKEEQPQTTSRDSDNEDDLAALAQELAQVEPAAGDGGGAGGSAGGFGFQSTFTSTPIDPINDVGPIGPTALVYDLPEFKEDLIFLEEEGPSLPTLPPPKPSLEVTDHLVLEDGSVTLVINAASNTPSSTVYMEIVLENIDSSWTVVPNGGVYDPVAGTITYTTTYGTETWTGGPTLSPPADFDGDMPNLTVKVINHDDETGLSTGVGADFDVITDAVADTPDVNADDATGLEDNPVPVNISASVTDTDGSEEITTIYITGVPAGFSFSAGSEITPGTWQLAPTDLAGLTISAPADYYGTINMTAIGVAEEVNKSDIDYIFSNDEAQNSDDFSVTWKPVIDPPSIKVNNGIDEVLVKEDGSVDVDLEASLNPVDSPAAFLTVTVTGIDPSWGFAYSVGSYDSGTGTWTAVLPAGTDLATTFTFTPPAESDIDLTGLVATAMATEPETSTTASATDDFFITVDAVADKPILDALNKVADEDQLMDITLNGSLGSDNFDSSEMITGYEISGVPAGFTFTAGTNAGSGVWTFTPAEIVGLQMVAPSGYYGTVSLEAKVLNTENPVSDGEFDTTDNDNFAIDQFTVEWKPTVEPPTITVNNGVEDAIVKEDGSVDVPLVAALGDGHSPNEVLTVTLTGIDPSWGFAYSVGSYNSAIGTWTATMPAGQDLSTTFTFTPPADSDIDLNNLVGTATAYEPATDTSASATDSFNIITDAVADTPDLDASNANGLELSTIPLTINTNTTDTDGSEVIKLVRISNVPTGMTLTAGTEVSPGVWELDVTDLAGLGINVPNHSEGTYTLNVESIATEDPVSDNEDDFTDNEASAFDTITLCIEDDSAPVVTDPAKLITDETDLSGGNVVVNGIINADFGTDGPGTFGTNGSFSHSGGSAFELLLTQNIFFTPDTNPLNGAATPVVDLFINTGVDDADVKEDGSVFVPVMATLGGNLVGTTTVLVLSGFDASWGAIDPTSGWVATGTPGEYEITLHPDAIGYNGGFTFTPAPDSDLDLTNLEIKAEIRSFNYGEDDLGNCDVPGIIYSDDDAFNVITDAVVDDPSLSVPGDMYFSWYAYSNHVVALNISSAVADTDGSEEITAIRIYLNDVFNTGGVSGMQTLDQMGAVLNKGTEIQPGVWEITVDSGDTSAALAGLKMTIPWDGSKHGDNWGQIRLHNWYWNGGTHTATIKVESYVGEVNLGGSELDLSDNTTVVSDEFDLRFKLTPLVLDLDNDGVELTSVTDGIMFDMTGDGLVDSTGWVGADDGLLAIDLDNSGSIDGIGELFGSSALDGFTLLAQHDSNNDGKIDAADAVWADLIVWNDANQDGVSQGSEMHELSFYGIESIDLSVVAASDTVNGNEIIYTGTFTRTDNTTGTIADAMLSVDNLSEDLTVAEAINRLLPQLSGNDLHGVAQSIVDMLYYYGGTDAYMAFGTEADFVDLIEAYLTDQTGAATDFNPDGTFTASDTLTSHGIPVTVTTTATGYVGMAGSETIFTLDINTNTGAYTFTLIGTLDHADTGNPDDSILLNFGFEVEDVDGDTAVGNITIEVKDDGAVAHDDFNKFDMSGGGVATGNVITGLNGGANAADELSEDNQTYVSKIALVNYEVDVPLGGTATINGYYGTLEIASDGSYTYTPYPNSGDAQDLFTYTLTDGDGDTSSAELQLCGDFPPVTVDLEVNGGADNVEIKEDGSGFVSVAASYEGGSGNETMTLTLTGVDAGWGFSGTGWVATGNPGEYTLTLATGDRDYTGGFTLTPPAESDIDDLGGLNVTATVTGPDANDNGSASDDFGVVVDAVADDPTITATGDTKEEGQPLDIDLAGSLGSDTDGSEMITGYQISGVPASGFHFGGKGTETSPGVWNFTVAEAAGLQMFSTDTTFVGTLNLTATVFTTENPVSDGEFDTTDNNNQASDSFSVTWEDDDEPVVTQPETVSVDETHLSPTTSISDKVEADFGDDAPTNFGVDGGFTINGGFFSATPLTSNGNAVTVTNSGNTYTGMAGGNVVFTLVLQADGNYTFTLEGTLDHPNVSNHNDNLPLEFGFTATDTDGDTADGVITVNVFDDGLKANDDMNTYNTADGGANGNVVTGLNGGTGAADDLSQDLENTVVEISFNGTTVTVPDGSSATINGTYGTLEMFSDGSYTYTLTSTSATGGDVHEFGETLEFPPLTEGSAIGGSTLNNLGINAGDLTVSDSSTGSVTFVSEGAGYNNTLGMYTVAADGTLQAATMLIANGNNVGADAVSNFTAGAGETVAFFIIADGYDTNGSYAGVDLENGSFSFVYDFGGAGQRAANIADDGSDVSLVYDLGGPNQQVLSGPVYHTTERGSGNNLNADDSVRIVSGLADDGDNTVLRIGFEDLPNLGDKDFEDIIFDVTMQDSSPDCLMDEFGYVLKDGDGDTSNAMLELCGEFPPVDVDLLVNNGVDNIIVKEDGSGFVTVAASYAGGNGNETMTLTLTGVDAGWGFSGTGWVATGTPGEYELTLATGNNSYTGGFTLTPPADSDVDDILGGLNVTASVTGPDSDDNDSASDAFGVLVDAVADTPTLNASNAGGDEGTTIALNISTATTDTDGSEAIKMVRITNVPSGMTLTAGSEVSPGVWELSQAQLAGLGINVPNGSEGTYTLNVESIATEDPVTDAENDYSDNEASEFDTITLKVEDDDQPEVIDPSKKLVDETDLSGGTVSVSHQVTANFGDDTPTNFGVDGGFSVNGAFSYGGSALGGALTSDGNTVNVTNSGNTYTGTAGGNEIFNLTINADGTYTFNLLGTLDHNDPNNPNDIINLRFGVTATDIDGDTDTGTITIGVKDDAPVANDDCNVFDVSSGERDFNVVLMLDVSGSMSGSKLDLLKSSVANLLSEYSTQANGGDVKVHIVPFSSSSSAGQTFTITSGNGYNDAISYINGLSADGFTNYESPIQAANSWLQGASSNDPISGADTYSYFISDGEPNRYTTGSSSSVSGDADRVMNEIHGVTDSSDDVGTLQSLSTEVIGVGIGVNSTTIARLATIDSDGVALDVNDPSDLNAELLGTVPLSGSADGNVITGENSVLPNSADNLSEDDANLVTKIAFGSNSLDIPNGGFVTIDGDYGTLKIWSDGSYEYVVTATAGSIGSGSTLNLDPNSADVAGNQTSFTKNGVTVTSKAPEGNGSLSGAGDLKWHDVGHGAGIGVGDNGSGDNKVWPRGEILNVDFGSEAVQTVTFTLADIGDNNIGHPLTLRVYLQGEATPVEITRNVPNPAPANGLWDIEISSSDFGGKMIDNVDLFNKVGDASVSFMLHDVSAQTAPSGFKDVFEYTLTDSDGDSSVAFLELKGNGGSTTPSNDPPVAENDRYYVYELDAQKWDASPGDTVIRDGSKKRYLSDGVTVHKDTGSDSKGFWYKLPVLTNDSDPDNDPLTITDVSYVSGNMTAKEYRISDDGKYILVRIGQDSNKNDSTFKLEYTISDGNGGSDTAYVTVCIQDENSPLVFDLDGDGIELTGLDNGVLFDWGPDGTADYTSWVGPDDGLLAMDRNSDGMINDHSELFGTDTVSGYVVLANEDSNADGVIDANDANWENLLIWQDANTDGISQAGEMFTLGQLGIASISLDAAAVDYEIAGNWISDQGIFTYTDGTTGTVVDAWFDSYRVDSQIGTDGDDTLVGGDTTDVLMGGDGDDTLSGGLGDDMLYGGAGADTFLFESIGDGEIDTIKDFNSAEGDRLDLSELLSDSDATQEAIDEFVFTKDDGQNTTIAVDLNGSGNVNNAVDVVVLEGTTGLSLDDLTTSHNTNIA